MPTSRNQATKKRATPWEHSAPAKVARKRPTKLTTAQKAHAKTRARKAGRSYPNLVDNMHEAAAAKKAPDTKRTARKKATGQASASKPRPSARTATKRTTTKSPTKRTAGKSTASKRTASKGTSTKRTASKRTSRSGTRSAPKAPTKDPHGGLTAAGRAEFARKDGAHLKPGVTKPESEMSRTEMRRKGSWAVRFYGRAGTLPPLEDADGQPTRFALTAAAWGEPVPKTIRAARTIAAKGRRLLARAKGEEG